jgi:hypothetical protein
VKECLKENFDIDHATLEITRYDQGTTGGSRGRSIIPDEP